MDGTDGVERNVRDHEARLDTIGWGVLFVAVGGVLLTPGLPPNTWLVGAGVVMLGTTVARVLSGLVVPWVTAACGAMALVGGAAGILGLESAAGPLVLIALGLTAVVLGFYRTGGAVSPASPEMVRR